MNKYQSVLFSILFHIVIFAIPVSMVATQRAAERELFLTIEDAHLLPKPVKTISSEERTVIQRKVSPIERSAPREEPVATEKEGEMEEPEKHLSHGRVEFDAGRESVAAVIPEKAGCSPGTIDTEFGAAFAPSFLHREMPVYPPFARKLGKEGRVLLRLTIDERGDLVNIEVIERAGYGFVEAAIDAVKKSTFLPAKKDGKAVASRALLPVRFVLRRDS